MKPQLYVHSSFITITVARFSCSDGIMHRTNNSNNFLKSYKLL